MHEFWPNPQFQQSFGILVTFLDFIFPITVLAYCYTRILWILKKRLDRKQDGNPRISTVPIKLEKAKTNVIKTVLIVVSFFFLCFIYAVIFYLMYIFGYDIDWNGFHYKLSVALLFLNCTVNPFIYLFNYRDFQVASKRLFSCNKRQNAGEMLQTVTSVT